MAKRKPKLKSGTRQYGKPKNAVSVAPCPWDMGADGPANRVGLVKENRGEVDHETGQRMKHNGVVGVRRLSVAGRYLAHGLLTRRQFEAADQLRKAWEQKDRSPPAIAEVKVDHSPKPDDRTAIIVDRATAYVRVSRFVPKQYAAYINHVARDDRHIGSMAGYRRKVYMDRLRKGLDMLADNMGL